MMTALRRPLLVCFVLACAVSLMDSGRLTLRLLAPSLVFWSFVPLLEILSLFAASRAAWRARPRAQTIDLFFAGHGAWFWWLAAFTAYCAFLPLPIVFSWPWRTPFWLATAGVAASWSLVADFRFFRGVLGSSPARALGDLLLQRTLAWTAGLALFVGTAGYQVLASRLGL